MQSLQEVRQPRSKHIPRRLRELEPIGNTRRFALKSRRIKSGVEYLITFNRVSGSCACNCPSHKWCWHLDRVLSYIRNTTRHHAHAAIVMPVAAVVEPPRPRVGNVGIFEDDNGEVVSL